VTSRLRNIAAVLTVLATAGVVPAAAQAAGGVDVKLNEATKWPTREFVLSLPSKQILNTRSVSVLENGGTVQAKKVTSQANNRKRGVVLAIDSSLTMRGEPIRQAMVAARSFARRRSESTAVGIVFFSRTPRLALAPTTDASQIKTALAVGPALTRGTKIFDAAEAGIQALKAAGLTSGAVIVLSDGAEAIKGSTITPAALAADARRSNIRIFSVGLSSASFNPASLRAMSGSTGGRYGEAARPKDLPPLFAAIGDRISSEYVVSYKSTVPAGTPVQVRVQVAGFGGTTTTSYRAPQLSAPPAPGAAAVTSDGLSPARIMAIVIAVFVVLGCTLFFLMRPKRRSVVARVTDFAVPGGTIVSPSIEGIRRRQKRKPSERWEHLAEVLELAEIRITPAALVLLTLMGTFAVAFYFAFVADRVPLMILALLVPLAVRMFVLARLSKRRNAFQEQLPDNLQVLASALRAGYSFSAALASTAEDAPEPSRSEFRRASNDEQLGTDISEALEVIARRMASPETEYVGIVARMQREAGGNTAEVLDQVIETIRARQQIKRMVRVLTSQGRMGGAIITAMPVVAVVGMSIQNPGYFDPMFDSSTGVILMIAGLLMLVAGWFVIRKIVDVEP
jgi:tight adherence protein B